MRNYCYFNIYKKYIETPMKQLNCYIEGLKQPAMGNRKPFAGVRCTNASIASGDYKYKYHFHHAETFVTPFHLLYSIVFFL